MASYRSSFSLSLLPFLHLSRLRLCSTNPLWPPFALSSPLIWMPSLRANGPAFRLGHGNFSRSCDEREGKGPTKTEDEPLHFRCPSFLTCPSFLLVPPPSLHVPLSRGHSPICPFSSQELALFIGFGWLGFLSLPVLNGQIGSSAGHIRPLFSRLVPLGCS